MSTATRLNYTPEDLLSMPDRGRYELVDGQLQERHMRFESSMIALVINARLVAHVLANRLGWVAQSDGGLQIFANSPTKVRFADGAFISRARAPQRPGDGHLRIAPDLVLEVVSPNDVAGEVDVKVAEYLEAGVRLIWVVYPETKAVHIFRPGGQDSRVTAGGTLSGEDVVPGFELPVSDIFDF
ncbi:MAG: Uma2 family endonuclease [Dehalococcoidia bacterium]